ncbi:unnamed protein product [Prorocentrum cordatum]|uniref:Uncharacterized protein n=1 Tax=Prorocentrum cordatum TaxID=2364126 RepID=A0ABN9WID8_9DINO|nr:unnamed protein product [Polarella glacialis]
MALLELHHTTGSEGYREAALRVLDFLRGCAGVFESPMAHKVARAAAMAGDAETARRIADFLVSQQRETGCYQEDPEAMDSIDQTAEIAVWLLTAPPDPARAGPPGPQSGCGTAGATGSWVTAGASRRAPYGGRWERARYVAED